VAILSGGTVDVLSHAAVRARNLGVMLAVCRDPDLLHEARRHADAVVCVSAAEVRPYIALGRPCSRPYLAASHVDCMQQGVEFTLQVEKDPVRQTTDAV
jgi:hypothetical protein